MARLPIVINLPARKPKDNPLAAYRVDEAMLTTPAAKRAFYAGILQAKDSALGSAGRLVLLGRPLQFAVLAVSFIHIWYQVSRVRPDGVAALVLPAEVHHYANAALTGAVDGVALYLLAARTVAALVDRSAARYSVWFFYILTAMLNGIFMLSFSPDTPADALTWIPTLDFAKTVLLALLIPVSLAAVERAHEAATGARLKLLVDVATLRELAGIPEREPWYKRARQSAPAAAPAPAAPSPIVVPTLATSDPQNGAQRAETNLEWMQRTIRENGDAPSIISDQAAEELREEADIPTAAVVPAELPAKPEVAPAQLPAIVVELVAYVNRIKQNGKPDWNAIGQQFGMSPSAARGKYRRAMGEY